MKLPLLVLMASMAGCASVGPRASAPSTNPTGTASGRVRLGARPLAPQRPEVVAPQRRAVEDLALARDARFAARDARFAATDRVSNSPAALRVPVSPRASVSPAVQGHAGVAASAPRPEAWTRERWTTLLRTMLPNQRLAHAAMWFGRTPVRVKASGDGFFVAVRIALP